MAFYEKFFKLVGSISMKNMVGFDVNRKLARYGSVKSIME